MSERERGYKGLRGPRYWHLWVGLALLRAFSALPFTTQLRIGRGFGRVAQHLARSRRRIAKRNIRLCFAKLTERERAQLVREHFENLGMAIAEMAMAYYRPQRFDGRVEFEGLEHLTQAMESGRGSILLSAHFGALEVGPSALAARGIAFDGLFRSNRNPLMNEFIRRGREVATKVTIEKNNIKQMIAALRAGRLVWYAPDQSYDRKQSMLHEFLGVPCMMNTATSSLARLGKANVVPFFGHRKPDCSGYSISILPMLEDFPSKDADEDTLRINDIIEAQIARSPAQYFWVHRKFKRLPESIPDLYADLRAEDQARD